MGFKILIVDDTPDTVQMLSVWLQGDGYQTVAISNSLDAVSVIRQEKPDLVLIDSAMPGRDGIETCQELHANPLTRHIPILLLSSKNPAEARADSLMAGAVDYVSKPINLRQLSDQIAACLAPQEQGLRPADARRMVDEVVYEALELLSCDLAWLFRYDSVHRTLESHAIAATLGHEAGQRLSARLGVDATALQVGGFDNGSPLAAAISTRETVLDLPLERFRQYPDTQLLFQGFSALGVTSISLIPLALARQVLGVLVVGYVRPRDRHGESPWPAITLLSRQAAMALDYTRLASVLAEQEESRKAEHAFLTTVLDTMGDGLIVIGEHGEIEYVNNRLLRMTEYGREELIGQRVDMLFHPDDRQALVYGLLHERGSTIKFDQRLYTRSQHVIPVLLSRSSFARIDPTAPQQVLVLSDLTVQKSREEALERYSQQLQALNRAAEAITSSLTPQEVIHEILTAAMAVANAEGASVLLRSDDNPAELVFMAAVGPEAERLHGMRVPINEGIAGWVVREATGQLVVDTAQDDRFYRGVDAHSGLTTRSLIAVPLIVADQVIGVLEVVNKRAGTFDRADMDLLESIAGTAAVAIENSRLFEQTRRRLNDLGTLLDASAAVSSTLDFGSVLELIARRLLDALHVERCQVISWDRGTNTLITLAEVVDAYWRSGSGPLVEIADSPLRNRALTAGRAQYVQLGDPSTTPQDQAELIALGQQAMLVIPLWFGRKVIGLASVCKGAGSIAPADIEHVGRIVSNWTTRVERSQQRWAEKSFLDDLCNLLQAVPGVMWVRIEEWLPQERRLRRLRETGFALWSDREGAQLDLDQHPTMKRVLSIAQPRVVERQNLEADPREQDLLAQVGGEVCLMAPFIIRGQPEGLVKLIDSDSRRTFDVEQVSLCQGIANVVGNALENAYLYQSLERRAAALEAAYAELKQADQLKEELLQNLSHEIQTPLMHVMGYMELMYNEAFGPLNAEQREKLSFVVERARHLSELARNIITVQALQARTLHMQPSSLDEILPRVISQWEPEAAKRSISLKMQLPDKLPRVMADPSRLAEVVGHLLSNAVKFSPTGAPIEVTAHEREGVVEVSVRDHGPGIAPEHHERIFRRFYQVDGGVSRKHGGAGLGLAIVQEVITQHGGRVWVESEPGQGSTFFFTVPKASTVSTADFEPTTGVWDETWQG